MVLRFDPEETRKLGLQPAEGILVDAPASNDVELCVVLGGDGTILKGLRRYARTSVPVFAVNFGEVGFLATIDPEDLDGYGFAQAFARDFEELALPAIAIQTPRAPAHRVQRRLVPPARRRARRAARLRRRGRGGRVGALRRARGVHAGGLDGLQPRQRRAGDGVGRGGLRRLVHRAALADGARAGRRAGRRAERLQSRPRGGRRQRRRPPGVPDRARRRARRTLRARRGAARAAAGLVVLPPAARRSSAGSRRSWSAANCHKTRAVSAVPSGGAGTPFGMLTELRVENLLLIERAELRLAAGLNVLTGETGAGKTVLAHALDLLLGGRAKPGIVRPGRGGGLRRGRLRARARAARRARRAPARGRRGGRAGAADRRRRAHARASSTAARRRSPTCASSPSRCSRSTASTSTAG